MAGQIIGGIIGVVVGILMVAYSVKIMNFFGRASWGERYFGSTDTAIKVIGIGVIIFSFLVIFGLFR